MRYMCASNIFDLLIDWLIVSIFIFFDAQPDYDESMEEPRIKPFLNSSRTNAKDKPQGKDRKYGELYTCFWSDLRIFMFFHVLLNWLLILAIKSKISFLPKPWAFFLGCSQFIYSFWTAVQFHSSPRWWRFFATIYVHSVYDFQVVIYNL